MPPFGRPPEVIPMPTVGDTWHVTEHAMLQAERAGLDVISIHETLLRPASRFLSIAVPGAVVATRAGVEVTYRAATLEVLAVRSYRRV